MSNSTPLDIDCEAPPFDQFRSIRWLAAARSGRAPGEYARYRLYVARDKRSRTDVLIKVTSKPGLVYERDLDNEIASLSTINRELPDSRFFPVLGEHGRLPDDRVYLTMSLFDERPLGTSIGPEPIPSRKVAHLETAIVMARALAELHDLKIWHVDLNPMNVLCRWESGRPVIRIVDFESSYEVARHAAGVFYNPPTTSGYVAPEVARQAPDARADVFSLGAVLYTMLAGYGWTWTTAVGDCVSADPHLDGELKEILLMAVEPDAGRRFQSMDELRSAIGEYLRP
jgi:serine/threonine protein kinase